MINKNMERDFKWIWIPKEIWLDEKLNYIQKLLLIEIDSLDNENWCFASNAYFAKFFWISETQISKNISYLKSEWYIEQTSFDWRQRVLKSCFKVELKADLKKTTNEPWRKVKGWLEEKLKHNNIYNNTSNNKDNNIISNDIIEAEASSITKQETYWNEEINSLLQIIKNNNDWLCAGTVKEQRRYWKMLLWKLKQFTKSWYDPLESLDVLLQKLDWNQFYWPKKVWPKDIYYNFEKLIQVVKWEIKKEKKREIQEF